jgi:hypothetical protein
MAAQQKTNWPATPMSFPDFSPMAGMVKAPWNGPIGTYANRVKSDMNYFQTDSKSTYQQQEAGSPYNVKQLGETIIHHVMLEGAQSWYNTIAPFEIVEDDVNEVVWNETVFDRSLAQPTPELGTVRLVTAQRKAKKLSFRRQGIGYYMEVGFSQTETGRMFHIMHLMQMQNGILEVIYADTVMTLISAHHESQKYNLENGVYKGWNVNNAFDEARWMFASLQKQKKALNHLNTKITERIQLWGGSADTWIVPPKFESFLAANAPEYTDRDKIGEIGPRFITDNAVNFNFVGGSKVFYSRSYQTGPINGTDNLLSREREIGEYVAMLDWHKTDSCMNYCSEFRSAQVYDEDEDDWAIIDLKYLNNNCELWDADGKPRPRTYGNYPTGPQKSGLNANDLKLDIFSYTVDDGVEQMTADAELFGQMEDAYFNTSNKLKLARTMRQKVIDSIGQGRFESLDRALNAGVDLARRIDRLAWRPEYETEIIRRFEPATTGATEPPVTPGSLQPTFVFKEAAQDPVTGYLASTNDDLTMLLPGMQSHQGLAYIARYGTGPIAREKAIAEAYLEAMETFTSFVQKILKRSLYTNRGLASSVFWYPSEESVWFEKVMFPYRPAMHILSGAANRDLANADLAASMGAVVQQLEDRLPQDLKPQPSAPATPADWFKKFSTLSLIANVIKQSTPSKQQADAIYAAFGAAGGVIPNGPETTVEEVKASLARSLVGLQKIGYVKEYTPAQIQQLVNQLAKFFNEHVNENISATNPGRYSRASSLRTALLASPTFSGSVYDNANNNPQLWPGNPYMDEFPAELHVLQRFSGRTGLPNPAAPPPANPAGAGGLPAPEGAATAAPAGKSWDFEQSSLMALTLAHQIGHGIAARHQAQQVSMRIGASLTETPRKTIPALEGVRGQLVGQLADQIPVPPTTPLYRTSAWGDTLEMAVGLADSMLGLNFHKSWNSINQSETDLLTKAFALSYDATYIHKDVIDSFIDNNVTVPIGYLFCRAHQQYSCQMGIKCLAGGQTARNFIKPGKFMILTDAHTQAHGGTLTAQTKTGLLNSRNVCVAFDIFMNGYRGGNGIAPIKEENYRGGAGIFTGQSVFVIAVPYNHDRTGPMSLSGHFDPEKYAQWGIVPPSDLHYPTAARYSFLWGFHATEKALISTTGYVLDPDVQAKIHNLEMLPGFYIRYTPTTKDYKTVIRGNGWTEGLVYIGVKKVHNGEDRFNEDKVPR